ncbi:MAG: hypothetical protein HFG28_14800 [Eubacterium sp.]|nr:hypothetical protein [Eubacterium sp.]
MRKKMLKSVGVLCLSVVLCMGMAGCSEKENMQPTSADAHTTNENGNNEDIETSGESVGNLEEGNAEEPDNSSEESNDEVGSNSEAKADSNEPGMFYDGANLSGRVVEITDAGFAMTPETLMVNEDGSMEGGVAASGYESDETNINITYAEDVVFQIINFSMSSQAETSREETDKNSIQKDTEVDIFGTCQDEKHWIADKVVIERWQ